MTAMSKKVDLKIVIVGAEKRAWKKRQAICTRKIIRAIMENYPDALFISGDCPKGGVDRWVREIATALNKNFKAYPPKKNSWYWYKKRNMQMARKGDIIISLEPLGNSSGGTWTVIYAQSIGKTGVKLEIE